MEVAEDTISGMTVYANRHFDLLLCGQPDSPLRTSTPWIRLSHDSSPESAVLAMQQGAVDFVTKPINMNRLLDAVRKGLAKTPAAVRMRRTRPNPSRKRLSRYAVCVPRGRMSAG